MSSKGNQISILRLSSREALRGLGEFVTLHGFVGK